MTCKNRKKFFLFTIFFVFVNFLSFGNSKKEFNERPNIEIQTAILCPVKTSLKYQAPGFSSIVSLDFSKVFLNTGFQIGYNYSDSVINCGYIPFRSDKFEVGITGGYHFYDFFSSFLEYDILTGSYISSFYKDKIKFTFESGTIFKSTYFKNKIVEDSMAKFSIYLGLNFLWNINKDLSFYMDIKSLDYFEYALIGTPFVKLGFNMNLRENIKFGIDCTVKLTDMFAVVPNPSTVLVSIFESISL